MISNMTLAIGGNLMKAVKEHSTTQKKPRIVKMEEDELVKKPRRIVKMEEDDPVEEKTFYSSKEVAEMDPLDVLEKFIIMTGITSLGCKHCGSTYRKESHVWDNWINSIYTRALKYGLSAAMKLPQSCDKQLASNTKNNRVNNAAYRIIRSDKYDNETKKKVIEIRQELLQEMGVSTRPHYYKV
jgi:hypothetical protein